MTLALPEGVRSSIVALLLLTFGAAGMAAAEPALRVETSPPRSYAYRNAFGETEQYVIVRYRLVNRGERPVRTPGLPVRVRIENRSLNDGFRPLVQAAFCRETGCAPGIRSTAELQGAALAPRRTVEAVAIFRVPSDAPAVVTLEARGEGEVRFRKVSSAEFAPVDASASPPSPVRHAAAPAPSRPNPAMAIDGPLRTEDAPLSWRVVQSAVPSAPGGAQ